MICVMVSLKKEIDYFLDILQNVKKRKISGRAVYRGWINGNDIEVIKTGIGSKSFDVKLLENCSRVISAGFCGALYPVLIRATLLCQQSLCWLTKSS